MEPRSPSRALGPLAALVIFNVVLSNSYQDALYLSLHGRDKIPTAMLWGSLLTAGVTLGLNQIMRRRSPPHILKAILAGLGVATFGLAIWNVSPTGWSTFWLFLLSELASTLGAAAAWSYFQAPLDSAGLRTLMPRLGAWAGLGGLLIPAVLRRLPLPQLLIWVSAAVWLVAVFLVDSTHAPKSRRARMRVMTSRELVQFPLARWMALATGGAMWLGLAVQYQTRVALQSTLSSTQIAQTMGLLLAIASVGGIAVQAFVTRPVLERWGVSVALAVLPMIVAALLGMYLWMPVLALILAALFVDKTLRPNLHRPAESCLVGALSPEVRPLLIMTMGGVVGPLLKAFGSMLLCLAVAVPRVWVVATGLTIALGLVALSSRWGSIYARALQKTLEDGSVGSSSHGGELIALIDGPRLKLLLEAIDNGSTRSRELALELLRHHRVGMVRTAMRARLANPSENVRIAALKWFAAEPSAELEAHAIARWSAPDASEAERIALLEATRVPEALLGPELQRWLSVAELDLRRGVLRALLRASTVPLRASARQAVEALLESRVPAERSAGLELVRELADPYFLHLVHDRLLDPSPQVRREALGCLTLLDGAGAIAPLFDALKEPFLAPAGVRGLVSLGPAMVDVILAHLKSREAVPHGSPQRLYLLRALGLIPSHKGVPALFAHLDAGERPEQLEAVKSLRNLSRLDPTTPIDSARLHAYVLGQLRWGLQLLMARDQLSVILPAQSLVMRELHAQVAGTQDRVSRALALLAPPGTMVRIFYSLKAPSSQHRDQARELLRSLLGAGPLLAGTLKLLDDKSLWPAEAYRAPLDVKVLTNYNNAFQWLAATHEPWIVSALRHDPSFPALSGLTAKEDPMQAAIDTILFLKDVALFEALSNQQLVEVARLAEKIDLPAGHVLFREGDPVDYLYLVRKGKLRVISGGAEIARLGPGEPVGEMAVLAGTDRYATVETADPSTLLLFDADDFIALLETYPEIGRGLLRALVKRLAQSRPQPTLPGVVRPKATVHGMV